MNRYMIICRLRWPALLLLTGIIALLDQANILSWGHAWPLYLILLGVLALAERATLAQQPPPVGYESAYPYGYSSGYAAQAGQYGAVPAQPVATSMVPANGDPQVHENKSFTGNASGNEEEVR